jgi:hypothetical protein
MTSLSEKMLGSGLAGAHQLCVVYSEEPKAYQIKSEYAIKPFRTVATKIAEATHIERERTY